MENVKHEKNWVHEPPRMNREQLLTAGDLFDFKRQLIVEIKTLLMEQNGQPAKQWLKSREVNLLPANSYSKNVVIKLAATVLLYWNSVFN